MPKFKILNLKQRVWNFRFRSFEFVWNLGRKQMSLLLAGEAREFVDPLRRSFSEARGTNFGVWNFPNISSKRNLGYTAAEIVVVLSIVAMMGVLTLVSFTGLGERGAINRSAQELALAIRDAQNKALGVVRIGTATPPAIGVRLTNNASSYFLFSDADNNRMYTPPADVKIGQDKMFIRTIRVDTLTGFPGGSPQSFAAVHITFVTPEASAVLTDGAGSSIGNQLDIRLASPSQNFTKTVTVRSSGQISIK